MWPNLQETEKILNGKLHFLCCDQIENVLKIKQIVRIPLSLNFFSLPKKWEEKNVP